MIVTDFYTVDYSGTALYGTFSLGEISTTENGGSQGWSYTLDNTDPAVQALGVGDTLIETFTINVENDNGGFSSQSVTVTINGASDEVIITSGPQSGAVTEDDAAANVATGAVIFSDTDDVTDFYTADYSGTALYGTFSLGEISTTENGGSQGWSYTLDNTDPAVQALGVGDTLIETFTINVENDNGGFSSQSVTVTINGASDEVIITSGPQSGAVTEDDAAANVATGAVIFSDTDVVTDFYTADYSGTALYGTFSLGEISTTENGGSQGWSYTLDNTDPAVQALGVGDTLIETFTINVENDNGGFSSQSVTVTINGASDEVIITSGPQSGAVTEDDAAANVATGAVIFSDTDDVTDFYTADYSGTALYGTFSLGEISTTENGGSQGWSYTLDNTDPAVQALGVGDTLIETFTINVENDNGGFSSQSVTVTINGASDEVIITSGPQSGAVTEDDAAANVATGAVIFSDTDVVTDFYTADYSGTALYGTFSLGEISTTENGGSQGWSYTLDNTDPAVQALGVGDTLIETFTINVENDNGGFSSQSVTVTINGASDEVIITSEPSEWRCHRRRCRGQRGHRRGDLQRYR